MILSFNFSQTFWLDPSTLGVDKIKLTSIDLYFMFKPPATGNRSGINNPGITLYLTDTIFNVPKITQNTYNQYARAEWASIITSSDASVMTPFRFPLPIEVTPGQMYAFVVSFDGNETFWPWVAKVGSWLVGTRNIYNGPAGNFTGKYFEYVSTDQNNDPTTAINQTDYTSYWRNLNDTTTMFDVNAARYFINGVPIVNASANLDNSVFVFSNNLIQVSNGIGELDYSFPSPCFEHVTFSLANSTIQTFIGAQKVWQNTVFYPGGYANGSTYVTVSTDGSAVVTANAKFSNGTNFNWNTVFGNYTGIRYVTLFDTNLVNVRLVQSVISNTIIQFSEPVTFSNNIAKFMISPIATVDSVDVNSPRGKKTEFLLMRDSNANSTMRFVNNCIEAITANSGGINYNNTDILYIIGYANVAGKVTGGYPAIANIVTNTSGGISTLYLSNQGCGFCNTSTILATIARANNSTNTTVNSSANGTGATFVYTIGATLCTELTNNIFKNCTIVNLDLNDATPYFDVFAPSGTTFELQLRSQYYLVNDATTLDGFAYYIFPGMQTFPNLKLMERNAFICDNVPVFMSRSNEFNAGYSNGAPNDLANGLTITTNNFILDVITTSNSDYVAVTVDTPPTITFGKYIINNDFTSEETNFGNCWAKHVTTRTNFARLSEDIRIYIDAYKPANTDMQVYARIQNSGDPEAFDDEDWTRLTLIDGGGILSSLANPSDYIELTYGFQSYPNTAYSLAGFIATTNNSANVVGTGTTFSSNLAVGNLVRIYDPLFPISNFIVAAVNAIADNTHLTLDQPLTTDENPALIQSGMKIDKMGYVHQAYNNIVNENVVRYYNTSLVQYDGYDILQIKVCLLSSHLTHYPKIHDIRATGISA